MTISPFGQDRNRFALDQVSSAQVNGLGAVASASSDAAANPEMRAKSDKIEVVGDVAGLVKEVSSKGDDITSLAEDLKEAKCVEAQSLRWIKHLAKILLPFTAVGLIYKTAKIATVVKRYRAMRQETDVEISKKDLVIVRGRFAKKLTKGCLSIAKITEKTIKKTKKYFKPNAKKAKTIVEVKEFGAVVMTPFYLASLVKSLVTFHKGDKLEVVEQLVDIVEDTKDIGENIVTVTSSLGEAKIIPASRIMWIKPFSTVMAVLSIASIISSVKDTIKMVKLLKEMKSELRKGCEDGKSPEENLKSMISFFETKEVADKGYIKETFGVKSKQFRLGVFGSNVELSSAELIRKLKGRVKQNVVAGVISGLSSTISCIGSIILVINPLLPVGVFFMAGTLFLDVGHGILRKIIDYRFVRTLDIKRTKLEWLQA